MRNYPHIRDFFAFCEERENIRKRKESGQPWPWTEIAALREAFYCNIYREDDKTTRWFKVNVRDKVKDDPERAFAACVLFRWVNKIETGEEILPWLLEPSPLPGGETWRETLKNHLQILACRIPVFSGAYIISSPLGDPKIHWATMCAANTITRAPDILKHSSSLERMHERLMKEQGLGPFMAYEIVTDLRHTAVLSHAPDIMTWANPGPGCMRGLGWIVFDNNKIFDRSMRNDILDHMRTILEMSKEQPWIERPWEMREVEHALCEYDKFRRVQRGDRPKRRYSPS